MRPRARTALINPYTAFSTSLGADRRREGDILRALSNKDVVLAAVLVIEIVILDSEAEVSSLKLPIISHFSLDLVFYFPKAIFIFGLLRL